MIAVLQFDAVSRIHLDRFLAEGRLPMLNSLRSRGTWYELETPATHFEGAAAYSLYTGVHVGEHGLYYPWLWSAREQRVRFFDDLSAPEAGWERLERAGRRSLVIDPYEMRPPRTMRGIFLTGWQFKNRVVLRTSSIPNQIHRSLAREFGAPPVGEEVYGRPAARELLRLRESLLVGPRRGADVVEKLLQREQFDMLWISLSAAHLGGHRYFDLSPISEEAELSRYPELGTALLDIYQAVDEALARIVASLPAGTDILVVSPSGMGPNTSRSHLLPGMLEAVMTGHREDSTGGGAPAGSLLWRIRAVMPTGLRGLVANSLPDRWALELAARLELRGVDWTITRAFMMPNDDAGYIRLNMRGRERDGIVDPREADALLNKLLLGLQTFRDADGVPVIRKVHRTAELGYRGPYEDQLPELVVEWNHRVVTPLAGASSPVFGAVSSPGWATGRTGCHTGDAWALVVLGSSKLRSPTRVPHIVDIVPTVCAAVGVDHDGLSGEPLLEPRSGT